MASAGRHPHPFAEQFRGPLGHAGVGGALLVQSRVGPRILAADDLQIGGRFERGPKGLARQARVLFIARAFLADRRQAEDLPLVARGVGHLPQQAAGQVVAVPAGVGEHDPGVGGKPRVQVAGIPLPDLLPHDGAFRILALAEGVVDDHAVGRVAHDRIAHARRAETAAAAGDLEQVHGATGRHRGRRSNLLAVELDLGKNLSIDFADHGPLHVAVHGHRQVVGVRAVDQPHVGVAAQNVGGKAAGDEFALAVLRRHENHQPPASACGYAVEHLRQPHVVPVGSVVGLGKLGEAEQALAGFAALGFQKFDVVGKLGHDCVKEGSFGMRSSGRVATADGSRGFQPTVAGHLHDSKLGCVLAAAGSADYLQQLVFVFAKLLGGHGGQVFRRLGRRLGLPVLFQPPLVKGRELFVGHFVQLLGREVGQGNRRALGSATWFRCGTSMP